MMNGANCLAYVVFLYLAYAQWVLESPSFFPRVSGSQNYINCHSKEDVPRAVAQRCVQYLYQANGPLSCTADAMLFAAKYTDDEG